MNQPTGRCPACGIGRFLPSGLCDHCGADSRPPKKVSEAGKPSGKHGLDAAIFAWDEDTAAAREAAAEWAQGMRP